MPERQFLRSDAATAKDPLVYAGVKRYRTESSLYLPMVLLESSAIMEVLRAFPQMTLRFL
jgi:hypothetical protein